MAPAARRLAGPSRLANGHHEAFQSQNAIRAAQVVSNLSQTTATTGRLKGGDRESFEQLLSEMLNASNDSSGDGSFTDGDFSTNYNLVSVVTRAGLDVLLEDDPFANVEHLLSIATGSLTVLSTIFQKHPGLLFESPPNDSSGHVVQPPMFIWLLPRLLVLVGRRQLDGLQDALANALRSIVLAAVLSLRSSANSRKLFDFLRGCITGLLAILEDVSVATSQSLEVILPSEETLRETFAGYLSGAMGSCQVTLRDSGQVCLILLNLLSLHLTPVMENFFSFPVLGTKNQVSYAYDCLIKLCRMISRLEQSQIFACPRNEIATFVIRFFGGLSVNNTEGKLQPGTLRKAITAQVQWEVLLLKWSIDDQNILLQRELSTALIHNVQVIESSGVFVAEVESLLVPAISVATREEEGRAPICKELETAFARVLRLCSHSADMAPAVKKLAVRLGDGCTSDAVAEVSGSLQDLQVEEHASDATDSRPLKRRRITGVDEPVALKSIKEDLIGRVYGLLGSQTVPDLDGLHGLAEQGFAKLSDSDRCTALRDLGLLACTAAGTLTVNNQDIDRLENARCSVCDSETLVQQPVVMQDTRERDEIVLALETLLKTTDLQSSTQPRVCAMWAVGRVARHSGAGKHLELPVSAFGSWCLQSHRSSLRELRLAAGHTLPVFLTAVCEPKMLGKNHAVALDFLRRLSSTAEIGLQESCVRAWGQVARVCTEDELGMALLRLVEYLGHTNSFVNGVAYEELSRLSELKGVPPLRLMTPYWRTIAIAVVKDLHIRPQTAQLLSELLATSVDEFLVLTQAFTIPQLVLHKKHDILRRIAQARGDDKLWYDSANMSATFALLFMQESLDADEMLDLLIEASERFENLVPTELAEREPVMTAYELLKMAGDNDENNRAKAQHAITRLATLWHDAPNQHKVAKKANIVGTFIEFQVLGIIDHFVETINGLHWQPTLEKKRCLRGIEAMIRLGRRYVVQALPQIGACLQSAFEVEDLRDDAISAWITMMMTLEEDDLELMLENTFAIIVLLWDLLQPPAKDRVQGMMDHLVTNHSAVIQEKIRLLPSLSTIPEMAQHEAAFSTMRADMDTRQRLQAFSRRCQHENITVVVQALKELLPFLRDNQSFLHVSAATEQPDPAISQCIRSLLDACVKFAGQRSDVADLCAQSIGLIGCLDPNSIEAIRDDQDIMVLSNFDNAEEAMDWVILFLQEILFKAFMSATNPRAQGFLGYAMQEFLKFCGLDNTVIFRGRDAQTNASYRRWIALPETVRNSLTPFLASRYFVPAALSNARCEYPIYPSYPRYSLWLRTFVLDLLQKGRGENAPEMFAVCSRVVRNQDISIAEFLIPFVALNVVVGGEEHEAREIGQELLEVLKYQVDAENHEEKENLRLCSETVFRILDYFSKWMQEKKKQLGSSRHPSAGASRYSSQPQFFMEEFKIQRVEHVLGMVPAEIISRRAVECKSFARALFHWERYIRQEREAARSGRHTSSIEALYERLQEIYTQIDEPDGIEGISVYLHVLNIDQQILEHRKAGRWMAAQSWFELQLAERPDDVDVQINLLTCLKESGQHDVLLNHIEGLHEKQNFKTKLLPFVTEAAWATAKWNVLERYVSRSDENLSTDFNVNLGYVLLALYKKDLSGCAGTITKLRENIARSLSRATTASLQSCHEDLLKLHVLNEIELISGAANPDRSRESVLETLEHRLPVLGSYVQDKQYLLSLRRATMQLSPIDFEKEDVAASWLTSARLARKGKFIHQSFNAAMHASRLGSESAKIEHARLLWSEGHHRKAIQSLEGAITADGFQSHYSPSAKDSFVTRGKEEVPQNPLMARAHLLLAKWLDSAGQTRSDRVGSRYQDATKTYSRWEKGHYYLGRHYNKLYESERTLAPHRQSRPFVTGETAKLVCQNYLRSITFGTKYIYQTIPRVLTLWLDLGSQLEAPLDLRLVQLDHSTILRERQKNLNTIHTHLDKVLDRGPTYVFYTALAQVLARICHPNKEVANYLTKIIVKVVSRHPQQALWSLLAVAKSSSKDRAQRGLTCLTMIKDYGKRSKSSSPGLDLRNLITQGQRLTQQLVNVCDGELHGKPSMVSISRDLAFSHKCAPCPLVIPLETTLFATLPTNPESSRNNYQLFSRDAVTIASILDDVSILQSLQRPRKISVRGSDGRVYGLLCKPRDDLRKDQRLMEFNAMINRSLKRDADSSKRRLYIRTYAVTPLNEECGLIEWVEGVRPFRDILLHLYKAKGITPHYVDIRRYLDEISQDLSKVSMFTDQILRMFPSVFHEWFVEMFPEPGAWFTARLKYTRSCAVVSMVGMVLGLGDRHGENILFEEGNGGTFHVDFNCLFDKGLTFEKPERVPFRLTHNMVDAFGVYGYEGPFRKSCELTLNVLRQNEDALLTILETFVYDPTTDFIGKKRKPNKNVPETPQDVLDSVRGKVRGLLAGETVPLSVEGHVDELIQQAVNPANLATMYIGWCAFF